MFNPFQKSALAFLLLILANFAAAQDKQKPAPDHGRVLACALDVFPHKLKDTTNLADTKNYVFRGKVISLGKDRKVSICYDTEHLRVAGAWVGKPMTFSADKNMGPNVEGEMLFATKPGPGWAKDRKWDDPREGKEGPLPRDWAHYKGMYLHGDKVVLSYSVGDMDVLEMPDVFEEGGETVIRRTIQVSPTKNSTTLLILEESSPFESDLTQVKRRAKGGTAAGEIADLKGKDWQILVGVYGLLWPEFEVVQKRLHLKLPKSEKRREFNVFCYKSKKVDDFTFHRAPLTSGIIDYTTAGPPRWTETLETAGILGDAKNGPYTIDQIQLPEKNPWNASIRFAGLDFFPDGRAALCTWDGDVWIVSGLDDSLKKVRWKRFAAGLQSPLGLKIINGIIHVAGRDQITKLHDLNNDGEADFYENFNNDPGLTLQRHEFVMDLQTDKNGNLYYCRSGHYIQSKRGDNCVIYKISPDGKKIEKFAKGFREPNGMSIGPDGTMTVADNEGNGIPQTPIYRLKEGANYGFTPSLTGKVNEGTWKMREQPIVWLGPKVDTSAGSQVWVPGRAEPRNSTFSCR